MRQGTRVATLNGRKKAHAIGRETRGGGPLILTIAELAEAIGMTPGQLRPVLDQVVRRGVGAILDGGGDAPRVALPRPIAARLGIRKLPDGRWAAAIPEPEEDGITRQPGSIDLQALGFLAVSRCRQPWEEAAEAEEAGLN